MHVAGCYIGPRRGDADLRLGEILVLEADGPQHGARRRLLDTVDHQPRMLARINPTGFRHRPSAATQKCEPFSLALVARPDQLEETAYALRFRAHGPPGPLLAVPRIEVQMQPVRRLGDKPLQK